MAKFVGKANAKFCEKKLAFSQKEKCTRLNKLSIAVIDIKKLCFELWPTLGRSLWTATLQ